MIKLWSIEWIHILFSECDVTWGFALVQRKQIYKVVVGTYLWFAFLSIIQAFIWNKKKYFLYLGASLYHQWISADAKKNCFFFSILLDLS